jgi:hypothetical protein
MAFMGTTLLELSASDDQSAILDPAVTHVLNLDHIENARLDRLESPEGWTIEHDETGHDESRVGLIGLVSLRSLANFGHAPRPYCLVARAASKAASARSTRRLACSMFPAEAPPSFRHLSET